MYSLVLMSAMTTAPAGPEFNGYFRDLFAGGNCSGCNGCNGCCGGRSYAASCNGCCGGTSFLGIRDRVRSWFASDGCCGGGCCGGCCGGGYAPSYGCCGGTSYGCSGTAAYSCFGGPVQSYTPVFNAGLSCQGGPVMAAPPPVFVPAPGIPYADPMAAPPPGAMISPQTTAGVRPAGFGTVVGASGGVRATVTVRLPADAKLYADGAALRLTGGERKFVTPELPGGMEYTYQLTAEYERNGEVVSVTKKVAVRAGGTAAVEFADLTAARPAPRIEKDAPVVKGDPVAAAPVSLPKVPAPPGLFGGTPAPAAPAAPPAPAAGERASITVKLPPGATLYVDDRKNASADAVRRFTTPPLPAGREFGYLLKAEVVRNGQPEALIQKVAFKAGEQVVVDFTTLGTGR